MQWGWCVGGAMWRRGRHRPWAVEEAAAGATGGGRRCEGEERCGEEEIVEPMWRRGGQGMWDEVGPGGGMGALVDFLSGVVSPRISLLAPALS